jgi:hypothetical protein
MDFYVYIHRKQSNGEVFYVGKGKDKRAWLKSGRTKYWYSVVNKHGLVVEIVLSGLQEWYAFELETDLITLYGRKDLGEGRLINMADGGEGASGTTRSAETRARMSKAKKGAVFSEEHRNNLSDAHVGKVLSESTRSKMSVYRKGRPHHDLWKTNLKAAAQKATGKKIVREDGVVFNSYLEAAQSVGDDPTKYASIAAALGNLINGVRKQQTVCGYTWYSV